MPEPKLGSHDTQQGRINIEFSCLTVVPNNVHKDNADGKCLVFFPIVNEVIVLDNIY